MPEDKSITFREAVMGSLLVHAGLVIFSFLNPDLFTSAPRAFQDRDPNEPILLQFLSQPPPEKTQM